MLYYKFIAIDEPHLDLGWGWEAGVQSGKYLPCKHEYVGLIHGNHKKQKNICKLWLLREDTFLTLHVHTQTHTHKKHKEKPQEGWRLAYTNFTFELKPSSGVCGYSTTVDDMLNICEVQGSTLGIPNKQKSKFLLNKMILKLKKI